MSNNNSGKVEELREKLAAIEHERWADWQKWVHEVFNKEPLLFTEAIKRWEKQIKTPYSELSDKEKASDMEQVDRYWDLIEAYISSKVNEEVIKELELVILRVGEIPSSEEIVKYNGELRGKWDERKLVRSKLEDRIRTLKVSDE